ncbi:MAG: hypothetical protein M0Q88_03045 [Bacilli bacterium]|nr:hypothetical protein [Bacilli bacterium]
MTRGESRANEINMVLKQIYDKDTTDKWEKKILLEAAGCVWKARRDKVTNVASFMELLYDYMGFDYDVDVEELGTETVFTVKTFKKR